MEMRYTKTILKNIIAIIGTIIALVAAIAAIGGNMLTEVLLSTCTSAKSLAGCLIWKYVLFVVLVVGGVLLFAFAIPIIVDLLIEFYKNGLPKIIKFFNTANPKNILIYTYTPKRSRGKKGEILLAIENDEWRFFSLETYAFVLLLRPYPDGDTEKQRWKNYNAIDKRESLKWITTGNSDPIRLLRWKSKELEFIKQDVKSKEFYIDTDVPNKARLKSGTYQFGISVIMFETKTHLRIIEGTQVKLPSRKRLFRVFVVTIKYDGQNLDIKEIRDATDDEARFF